MIGGDVTFITLLRLFFALNPMVQRKVGGVTTKIHSVAEFVIYPEPLAVGLSGLSETCRALSGPVGDMSETMSGALSATARPWAERY